MAVGKINERINTVNLVDHPTVDPVKGESVKGDEYLLSSVNLRDNLNRPGGAYQIACSSIWSQSAAQVFSIDCDVDNRCDANCDCVSPCDVNDPCFQVCDRVVFCASDKS